MLTVGSLFAGIGGFDLGFQRAGMRVVWQVEIDPFCRRVLAKHWPDVERFGDVRECGKHNLRSVDLVCGGFPCQPFSGAGKQRGEQDDRNLWPEMRRIVAELRPDWVVGENVPGIRNIYLDTILSDLEGLDYTAAPVNLPAVAFGAPHIRHRFFIVAHANRPEQGRREQPQWGSHRRDAQSTRDGAEWHAGSVAHATGEGLEERVPYAGHNEAAVEEPKPAYWWAAEPDVGRVAHGVPDRVDRVKALGNAIVPQGTEWLGLRILETERLFPMSGLEAHE